MSAVAKMAPDRPASDRDAVRWGLCFIIAAAVHGAVALCVMNHFLEPSEDSGIDAPVVMLDLPEALTPSIAPPQDLPPGPMELNEVEETPPPKEEEAKQPEPEAEVALPKPEPPKPEKPPAEKMEIAAPAVARTPPSSIIRWQSQLSAHIERFKRYPAAARAHGNAGTAVVSFTIDHEGRLLRSSIVQSSGSAALDQETLAMLARAQPMPRPPDRLTDGELTFVMPVRFSIR